MINLILRHQAKAIKGLVFTKDKTFNVYPIFNHPIGKWKLLVESLLLNQDLIKEQKVFEPMY